MARVSCRQKPNQTTKKLVLLLGASMLGLSVAAQAANNLNTSNLRGSVPLKAGNTSRPLLVPVELKGVTQQSGYSAQPRTHDQSQQSVEEIAEHQNPQLVEDNHPSGFLDDIGSTFLYLRDNIVPVVLFRGSTDAVSERDVTYTLPASGPLRASMMHSANVYEGLRGGSASVADTVASALRGSYSSRARLEKANVDRARVHGALANFLPKLEGSVTSSIEGSSTVTSTNSNGKIGSVGLELSMPLYTSGVNRNLYRQAQHTSRASAYSYLAEEQRVALEAVTAHINLRLNRRIEELLKANVRSMQKISNISRRLFEAGDSSRTDIAIAEANVESARSEVDLARKTREEIRADYESITGKQAPRSLGKIVHPDMVPASLEEAIDLALSHNPTLASTIETAAASKHAARAELGRYGPQVSLFGSYNREFENSDDDELNEDWRLGVRLRVPLFDATLAPNVNAARHEALESGYRALDQRRLVERQIETQWSNLKSAKRRVSIVRRQIRAIQQSVEGARREYEAGFRSVSDVLSEQVKLVRARITLERVLHEEMLAGYELAFTTATPNLRHLAAAR